MTRNCFVPHCYEGNKSQIKKNKLLGIRQKTMFTAPKDALLLEKWSKAIQRADKKLRPGIDFVCEKHFDETYISRYFETKMPDGSVNLIERGRLLLKKNAIPSIFSDLPCLTMNKPTKKKIAERNICSIETISSSIDNISKIHANLQNKLKNMKLPDDWFFCYAHSSLVLGYLDSNHELIKRIIISNKDLHLKVFIKNKQVNITQTPVTCIKDIKKIIKTVDDIKMGSGTEIDNSTKSDQCCEYVNQLSLLNQVQCCAKCAKERKFNMDIRGLPPQKSNIKPTTKLHIKNVYCNKQLNK